MSKNEPKQLSTFRFRPGFKKALQLEAKARGVSMDKLLELAFFRYREDVARMTSAERAAFERECEDYLARIMPDRP